MARERSAFNVVLPLVFAGEAALSGCTPQNTNEPAILLPSLTASHLVIDTPTFTPTLPATVTMLPTETPFPTFTPTTTETPDPLTAFIRQCTKPGTGAPDMTCVFADGIMAIHLIHGDEPDIPKKNGVALLRNDAWENGVVGIVAHDKFEGHHFYALHGANVTIDLIWSNGKVDTYQVNSQDVYYTNWYYFKPVDGGRTLSGDEMTEKYFCGGDNLNKMVLQTCVSEGRVVFVVAFRVK